jgi:hypothetical protein
MNRTDAFLQHFSAQPYDPVKAHEYYLKNRDLKGRSTSGMSQLQKEAWSYSKDQVSTDKKQQMEIARVSNEKKLEFFQATAEATRERISEKLKRLSDKLTKEAENNREEISDKLKEDIANVAPIPKGISAKQRVILVERRNKEIDKIRNNSSKYSSNLSSDTKELRRDGSDEASGEREKTRTDLKALITTTRDAYVKEKAKLVADYETTYQKEYAKVLATVAGKPKKTAKAKAKGKAKKDVEGGFYLKKEWDAKKQKK